MVTSELMKNIRTTPPADVAKIIMRAISMNYFFIPGSNLISIYATLKAQFSMVYCQIFGPLSIVCKMFDDSRIKARMEEYR